ncbi:MAG: ssDNA-binding domain-containing protein [Bacteroidales bacterium]|nr:ssDNA-binding domain-containing protein [Bacteroidales bacterium]
MSEDYRERPEYKSLTRSRQMLVDAMLDMLGSSPEWHRGWKATDVPVSMTGREYRGENNVSLTMASIVRGYSDPRWMTFNQMRNSGWSFKKDADGKSMGKDAGIAVSFYQLRDKKTKKQFERDTIRGLSRDEQERYMRDNVYPLRRSYVVFNASIIDGIPEMQKPKRDDEGKSEDADAFMKFWDENMTPIRYGGDRSCFVTQKNIIRLPRPEAFESRPEFYATAFHEISHSCQGFTRPGVTLSTDMGSPEYRKDELSAEISGVFLSQKLCRAIDTKALKNSAAYLESWLLGESDEGKMFFDAVTEADKLSKYALDTWGKNVEAEADEAAEKMRELTESAEQESLFAPAENPDGGSGEEEKLRAYPPYDRTHPLAFRPESPEDGIPQGVMNARLALLSEKDQKLMKEELSGCEPSARYLYFGGDLYGSPVKNAAATVARCAFVGGDEETTLRLFKGSAWASAVPPKEAAAMARESVGFTTKYRAAMMMSQKHPKPGDGETPGQVKRRESFGDCK